jgi:exosortase
MNRTNVIDTYHRVLLTVLFLGAVSLYWTVVPKMAMDWWNDPNFSHGLIVPVFSAYLIWEKRNDLKPFSCRDSAFSGLLILFAGAVLLVIGKAGGEYFTMRLSLVLVIGGLFRVVFGKDGFRRCLFPLGFLLFMIPIPYILYDGIAFPLKMVASWIGEHSLRSIGVPVFREGNIISLPTMVLEVADACSGIRSLFSLLAVASVAAYLGSRTIIVRTMVVISAVPIAVVTNSTRIVGTGVFIDLGYPQLAQGFFHTFSGWLIFLGGFALILATTLVGSHLESRLRAEAKPAFTVYAGRKIPLQRENDIES